MRFFFDMQLESLLKVRMGKAECEAIAAYTLERDDVFVKLLDFVEHGDNTQAMKAAWVIGHVRKMNQAQSMKHQDRILKLLQQATIGGVQRELLKAMERLLLKEANDAALLDYAWNGLSNMKYDIAVRYSCLRIIRFYSKRFPEFREELKSIESVQLEKTGRFP